MTGHEVSAASQEGVCILACIFVAIAHLWPVFYYNIKLTPFVLLLIGLSSCKLITS